MERTISQVGSKQQAIRQSEKNRVVQEKKKQRKAKEKAIWLNWKQWERSNNIENK